MGYSFIQRGLFERINKECLGADMSKQRVCVPFKASSFLFDNSVNRTVYVCRFSRDKDSGVFVFDKERLSSKYSGALNGVVIDTVCSWNPNVVNIDYMPGKKINLELILHMCEDLGYTIKYYMPDWVIAPALYEQLKYKKQVLEENGSGDPKELEDATKKLIEKERMEEMLNDVVKRMKKKVDDATPKPEWPSVFAWWNH